MEAFRKFQRGVEKHPQAVLSRFADSPSPARARSPVRARLSRFTALLLTAAAVLSLSGCGGSGQVTVMRVWDREESVMSANGTEFRVGMVTDVSGVDDQSFNWSAWQGLQALSRNGKIAVSYLEPQGAEDSLDGFCALAEEGYDIVWGVGYTCADNLLEAASRYPDTRFAVVDCSFEDTPDNVACVLFRAEDSSFLAGYIAARVSRSGIVGFIGGMESETISQFEYGFKSGIAWAGHETLRQTRTIAAYAGTYSDPARGRDIARSMIAEGCDIIFPAAGGTGTGAIQAASDAGVYAIGVDMDQSFLDPDHVLTSALKNVSEAVRRVSNDWLGGGELGGTTVRFGLAEGGVGIPTGHHNFSDLIYDDALALADKIMAEEVVPSTDAEYYARFLAELFPEGVPEVYLEDTEAAPEDGQ